jgi:integrase
MKEAKLYPRIKRSGSKTYTYYVVRFSLPNGKVKDKQFTSESKARELVGKLNANSFESSSRASLAITVEELANEFMCASRVGRHGRAPLDISTLRSYQTAFNTKIIPMIGKELVRKLDRQMMSGLAQTLSMKCNTRATARGAFAVLKSSLSFAVERDYIKANPCTQVVVHSDRRELVSINASDDCEDRIKIPSIEDVSRILILAKNIRDDHIHSQVREAWKRYYPVMLFFVMTGCRASEVRAVRWNDIDWEGKYVRIRRKADGLTCEIGALKTRHARREVPIPTKLYDELLTIRGPDQDYLFAGHRSGRPPAHSHLISRCWYPLLDKLKIKRIGIHSLRHYYASQLIEHQVSLLRIRTWMGHHSTAFTMDQYGHLLSKNDYSSMKDIMFTANQ